MSKWIEHIDRGDGKPICTKNKTNREIVNDFDSDVDPDVICKECINSLSSYVKRDFKSFWTDMQDRPFQMFSGITPISEEVPDKK